MNRIATALLVLAWTQILVPRSSEAATVGDCVAMYFYKPGCQQCLEMQRPIEQVIESGWAVRGIDVSREPEGRNAVACNAFPDARFGAKQSRS